MHCVHEKKQTERIELKRRVKLTNERHDQTCRLVHEGTQQIAYVFIRCFINKLRRKIRDH